MDNLLVLYILLDLIGLFTFTLLVHKCNCLPCRVGLFAFSLVTILDFSYFVLGPLLLKESHTLLSLGISINWFVLKITGIYGGILNYREYSSEVIK